MAGRCGGVIEGVRPTGGQLHGGSTSCGGFGKMYELEDLGKITDNFSEERLLGEGGFGKVYKGLLQNGDMIAVKKLTSTMPGIKDRQFDNEAQHLMRLSHPNIVQLVGYCSHTEEILVPHEGKYVYAEKLERLLCLEYLPKGSLHEHLSDESSGLDWDMRFKIIEGICNGLHYLHEKWQASTPIIHMDLKPKNILLDDNMMPKIADFGLSRLFGEEQTRTCTANRDGTLGYMAPEYLNRGIITTKLDVFSLGVIIIEIITGRKDYPDETETSSQEFIELVLKNWRNRPGKALRYTAAFSTFPSFCREIDYQQIRRCIQIGLACVKFNRTKRPTTLEILNMLHKSEGAECSKGKEATKVTNKVHSRVRTDENGIEREGGRGESHCSERGAKEEPTSTTPRGDAPHGPFSTEENSPGKSVNPSSDESGEGKVSLHKIFSSKAEALLNEKGITWPWKGRENEGPDERNHVILPWLHGEQENSMNHQVSDSSIAPDAQGAEYNQPSKNEASGSWSSFNNNSTSSANSTGSTNSSALYKVDHEADCLDYEILWEDLVIGEQIGQGSCGTVYHALWYGSDVAVKVFSKQEYSEDVILTFRQEVSLMLKLRHPNIILFMGAVTAPQRLCIVTEFLPHGSLFRLLQRAATNLDVRRRVHMALDIARGMNYLHHSSPPIIHRDLKSSNLLVDKNWTVKVASRLKRETFLTTKTGKGTPQWMAPEVLRDEPSDEKSDVYSYGVILWELVTQMIPWENLNSMQVIEAVGFMNQRLDIPSDVDPQWKSIILSCWESDPQQRPSFQELLERLRELQRHYAIQQRNAKNNIEE